VCFHVASASCSSCSYFHAVFDKTEALFGLVTDEEAFYIKHEPLRHPPIFYFGHTACFFVNKLILANQLDERINPKIEHMCAVGVDEMSWDDLNDDHYDWPAELFHQISLVSPLFFARALWQIALPPLGGVAAICYPPLGVWHPNKVAKPDQF
jgi:hypothetical protein